MTGGCFVRLACLTVLLVSGSAFVALAGAHAASPPSPPALAVHAPILIEGNAAFTSANGVTSGSGTAAKPYMIQGWEIDANMSTALEIRNTTAYFLVQLVTVTAVPGSGTYGVVLDNVTNARIFNVNVTANWVAIRVVGSTAVNISASFIRAWSHAAVEGEDSMGLSITTSSLIAPSGNAVWVARTDSVMIFQDELVGNLWTERSTLVVLEGNRAAASPDGFVYVAQVANSDHVSFFTNDFTAGAFLVRLEESTNVTMHGNLLGPEGLELLGTSVAAYASHVITPDNFVVGKPLLYYAGVAALSLNHVDAGQIILANLTSPTLSNVATSGGRDGILAAYTDGLTLSSAIVNRSAFYGLHLVNVTHATVSGICVVGAQYNGLEVEGSANVTVRDAAVTGGVVAADFTVGQDLRLENLTASDVAYGVDVDRVSRFVVEKSSLIVNNTGLRFTLDNYVSVSEVSLQAGPAGAFYGIESVQTRTALVALSFVSNFSRGIDLDAGSRYWLVYGNRFVSNAVQAIDASGGANLWNATYPTGGNYWSDYTGYDDCSGPNQDVCNGGDGFGDIPYYILGGAADRYPIIYVNPPNSLPDSLFSCTGGPYRVNRPIFCDGFFSYDLDGTIVAYEWSASDGAHASGGSFTHAFTSPGNFSITLTVTDNRGGMGSMSQVFSIAPAPTLALVLWTSAEGYRLPVPRDWTQTENFSSGGSVYDLFAEGTYDGMPANLLVDGIADPAAQESHGYLQSVVDQAVAEVRAQFPGLTTSAVAFRTLSGHAAAQVTLYYAAGMYQDLAVVTSQAQRRSWMIILTADRSEEANLNSTFEQILTGFQITAATPGGGSLDLFVLWVAGGAAVGAVAALIAALLVRRRKKPVALPPPYPPEPPVGPAPPP